MTDSAGRESRSNVSINVVENVPDISAAQAAAQGAVEKAPKKAARKRKPPDAADSSQAGISPQPGQNEVATPAKKAKPPNAEHPPVAGSQQPSEAASPSQDQQKQNEVSAGNVSFKSEDTMEVGTTYPVLVLVSPTVSKADLEKALQGELQKARPDSQKTNADQGKLITEEIKVTPKMRAHLAANADEFEITPITPEDQDTTFEPITRWEWSVKPLKGGNDLKLDLTLSLVVGGQEPHALETYHRFILVKAPKVSFLQRVQDFIGGNWQWLWATLIVPLAGWLWNLKKKRKQA